MCILSIITPHYNMASSIERTIASVPLAHDQCIEHIIIDDCSEQAEYEKLKEVIASSNNKNIKLFRNEENVGPIETINFGAKEATGKYLLFLSSDDWVEKNFITNILTRNLTQNDSGIIVGDICVSYNVGSMKRLKSFRKGVELKISPPAENILDGFMTALHGQAIIRRDLFLRYGLYNKNLKWNSDLFLHVKIATVAGVYYIPEISGYFSKNYLSYGNKKNYLQQSATLDTLFDLLDNSDNTLVRQIYRRSGTLGKEPYSLKYLVQNKHFDFVNLKFIAKFIIFKARRLVLTSTLKRRIQT